MRPHLISSIVRNGPGDFAASAAFRGAGYGLAPGHRRADGFRAPTVVGPGMRRDVRQASSVERAGGMPLPSSRALLSSSAP